MKSEISKIKPQATGVRVDFKCTLDDGREHYIRGIKFNTVEQAQVNLIGRALDVESSYRKKDAVEAVSLGLDVAHKTATINDVYFEYLNDGYNTENPLESYNKMSRVAPQILSLGLTVEQMAVMFNEDVDTAQGVFDKWDYLSANEAEILAYKSVVGGA